MKDEKMKCPICNKQFIAKKWVARKGVLKGCTIINKVMCSNKCRKRFKLLIELNNVIEELDRLE